MTMIHRQVAQVAQAAQVAQVVAAVQLLSFNAYQARLLADDDTYQVYVQNSINRIETVLGKIKHKYAKGNIAFQFQVKRQ